MNVTAADSARLYLDEHFVWCDPRYWYVANLKLAGTHKDKGFHCDDPLLSDSDLVMRGITNLRWFPVGVKMRPTGHLKFATFHGADVDISITYDKMQA